MPQALDFRKLIPKVFSVAFMLLETSGTLRLVDLLVGDYRGTDNIFKAFLRPRANCGRMIIMTFGGYQSFAMTLPASSIQVFTNSSGRGIRYQLWI